MKILTMDQIWIRPTIKKNLNQTELKIKTQIDREDWDWTTGLSHKNVDYESL